MIRFYGYRKCGTCRKAEKALQACKRDYTFIDITEDPPASTELEQMITQSGLEHAKLFNTSGVLYRELKLKDKLKTMSKSDMIALLAGNGRLIKRPLVTDGKHTTVGFREETFKSAWCD